MYVYRNACDEILLYQSKAKCYFRYILAIGYQYQTILQMLQILEENNESYELGDNNIRLQKDREGNKKKNGASVENANSSYLS